MKTSANDDETPLSRLLLRIARRRAHECAMRDYRLRYQRHLQRILELADDGELQTASDILEWDPAE